MKSNNVLKIARDFLYQGEKRGMQLTPLQLMKLTYIAHGVKMAILDEPMFMEEVEAWRYGPVIRRLFEETKEYGNSEIPHDALDDVCSSVQNIEIDEKIVGIVLDKWGKQSGPQLSTATHQVGTPWHRIWNLEGGKYTGKSVIPNKSIQEHYKQLLNL